MTYTITPFTVRKRPIVVHALRFNGGAKNASTIMDWIASCDGEARWHEATEDRVELLFIDTLEGTVSARVGDWVLQGVHGEFYPVNAQIFAETYEVLAPPRPDMAELWP